VVGVALFFLPTKVFGSSAIQIGEIGWNGSSRSSADEWVELWNLNDEPIPLTGIALNGVSGEGSVMYFDETDVIAPHSVFLIANYPAEHEKSALSVQADVVTTTLSLSNDSFALKLVDSTGTEIDHVGVEDRASDMTNTDHHASMVRDSSTSTTWIESTVSQNFDADVSDLGTPGICDGCATVEIVDIATSTENIFYTLPLATSTMDHSNQLEVT